MNKSESIKMIAIALTAFQEEVENPKNTADNPFFKSKYAPLPEILTLYRPLLAKHGLSIFQSPGGDGVNVSVTTMLMHISGEWIESDPLSLKADKATAQGACSAITYGRRYSLSAALGISSEDDDDGNHASQGNDKPKPASARTSQIKAPAVEPKAGPDNAGFAAEVDKKLGKDLKNIESYKDEMGNILCSFCELPMPEDEALYCIDVHKCKPLCRKKGCQDKHKKDLKFKL